MAVFKKFTRWGLYVSTALACSTACATSKPNADARLASDIAEVLVAHHAHEQATPMLQRALAADPDNPRIHSMLGLVLRDRGLFPQAEEELLLAHRMAPNDSDTIAGLGVLYDQWDKHAEAEVWHRAAIALIPNSPDVYNNLGFSLYLDGRIDEAVVAYNEALRRDPGARRVYNNLGFAKARQKDYVGALKAFENGGGKAAAIVNLGLAYELAGDAASAKGFYEQALQLDHGLTVAKRNLAELAKRETAADHDAKDLSMDAAETTPLNPKSKNR